jgi:uncharacterized protein YybS (DUF2232 family)
VEHTPTDTRNVALLSVATMAAGFLVLAIPYVGFPLAAFALSWVTYRFSPGHAAVLALAVSAVVAVFGPSLLGTSVLDGLLVAVTLLAVGPVAAILLRRFPALNVTIGLALVVTAAFLASPFGAQGLALLKEMVAAVLTNSGSTTPATDAAALKATVDYWVKLSSDTWPASSFYTMALSTAISVPFIARAGRSLGQTVKTFGPLAELDVNFNIVWPTILGLGLTALGTMWSQAPSLVALVGQNALMMVRPLLFLQGAAVFAALYRRMKAGRVVRTIALVLLFLTEILIPSVSVIGAVDLFLNLRKIPRAGSQPKVTAL